MNCPSEFTCSLYADGELAEVESREVRIHLESCKHCRGLVEQLLEESRALSLMFTDAPVSTQAASPTILPLLLGVLGITAVLRLAWDSIMNILGSLSFSDQVTLIVSSLTYFFQSGYATAVALIETSAMIAMTCVLLTLGVRFIRRQSTVTILMGSILIVTLAAAPTYAAEVRRGNAVVTVGANEIIDNTLIAAGESIVIDGTVNGDLFAAGRDITIRGTVKGDVIGFAQTVEVTGTVEGNFFGFGQNVQVRGNLLRNLYGAGQLVEVGTNATVGGGATGMAATMNVDGTVNGDAMSLSGTTNVHGAVGRNLDARSDRVTIFSGAKVAGNFDALVQHAQNVQVLSGATIGGRQNVRIITPPPSRYRTLSFYFKQLLWLIGAMIAGVLVFWLVPSLSAVRLDTGNALLRSGGFGFAIAVATPIAVIVMAITIIGLPVALISLALWLLLLYLAKIVIAQFVGRALLRGQGDHNPALIASLFVGLAIVAGATNLPYVGGLINLVLTLLGFGAIVLQLSRVAEQSPGRP